VFDWQDVVECMHCLYGSRSHVGGIDSQGCAQSRGYLPCFALLCVLLFEGPAPWRATYLGSLSLGLTD